MEIISLRNIVPIMITGYINSSEGMFDVEIAVLYLQYYRGYSKQHAYICIYDQKTIQKLLIYFP